MDVVVEMTTVRYRRELDIEAFNGDVFETVLFCSGFTLDKVGVIANRSECSLLCFVKLACANGIVGTYEVVRSPVLVSTDSLDSFSSNLVLKSTLSA